MPRGDELCRFCKNGGLLTALPKDFEPPKPSCGLMFTCTDNGTAMVLCSVCCSNYLASYTGPMPKAFTDAVHLHPPHSYKIIGTQTSFALNATEFLGLYTFVADKHAALVREEEDFDEAVMQMNARFDAYTASRIVNALSPGDVLDATDHELVVRLAQKLRFD